MRKMMVVFVLAFALVAAARERDIAGQGRVVAVTHEGDGYRVTLDRANFPFRVPDSLIGQRQIAVGMRLLVGGVLRNGEVQVERIVWPDGVAFNTTDKELSGRIERINVFEQRLWLRGDDHKLVEVDTRSVGDERFHRRDLKDVHVGDRVTLRGTWSRQTFRAFSIESISGH